MKDIALISDFDGTISDEDFFWSVVDRFLKPEDMAPWHDYLAGKISHFKALNQIFGKLRVPEKELLKFIDTIEIDSAFTDVARFCSEECVSFFIVSAGCDYYINRLIGPLIERYNITLVTNHGIYNKNTGLQMIAPIGSCFYDCEIGVSKAAVVKLAQENYRVVYAGDGPPDVAAAEIADVVFAKKTLLERCRENGRPTKKFDNFTDILHFLQEGTC